MRVLIQPTNIYYFEIKDLKTGYGWGFLQYIQYHFEECTVKFIVKTAIKTIKQSTASMDLSQEAGNHIVHENEDIQVWAVSESKRCHKSCLFALSLSLHLSIYPQYHQSYGPQKEMSQNTP